MTLDLSKLSDLTHCVYGSTVVTVTKVETTTRWYRGQSRAQRSRGYVTSGRMIVLLITTPDYVLDFDCGLGREGKRMEKIVRSMIQ